MSLLTVLSAVSVLLAPVQLVSVTTGGVPGDGRVHRDIEVDGSGRYVAFTTRSGNLSPDAPDGGLFIRDLDAGTTTLFAPNLDDGGAPDEPSFDATGRRLAFVTGARLSPLDGDSLRDAYVTDLRTGVSTLATPDIAEEVREVRLSDDGAHVAVIAEGRAYAHDLTTAVTTFVDGEAAQADLSADGRYVVFSTGTPGLVPDDVPGTPGYGIGPDTDIFVRDLWTGALDQITVAWTGAQTGSSDSTVSISADGSRVVFASAADDLTPGDTNVSRRHRDAYVRDRVAGVTAKVSLNNAGEQVSCVCHEAVISADGRYVAFRGVSDELSPDDADNWGDIFVRDLETGLNTFVSPSIGTPDGHSEYPSISGHGETVAFVSANTGLAPPDTNNGDDAFAWRR